MRSLRPWVLAGAIVLALSAGPRAACAAEFPVTGVVRDAAGSPIEYATVNAPALKRGVSTDADGSFTIVLPGGEAELVAQQVGYVAARVRVLARAGLTPLVLTLRDEPVALAEVTVRTSSFGKAGKSEGAVVSRMDVYTTPGGAADVFQSLRALPGINAPNEGAAVYVRGGDPRETLIRLDGGDIGHPYHYEGASGGLFAAFDNYMLKSAFFSSGGFSSKYGGVLSGVLDIETQDPMNTRTVSVGANLAGASLSSSWALVPDRLSIVGAGGLSTTTLLHRLYGTSRDYPQDPASDHGALKAILKYAPTGRLSATYLGSSDRVGVVSPRLNFEGTYAQRARNHYGVLQVDQLVAKKLALTGVASWQDWRSHWTYGAFGGDTREAGWTTQADAVWAVSAAHEISFGARVARNASDRAAISPADSTDFEPGAPDKRLDTRARVTAPGAYVEDKFHLAGPLYATLGGRADRLARAGGWTFDPRGALAVRLAPHHMLRVAGGRYHQSPDPAYLDPVYGNPDLASLEADHAIVGYEWLDGDRNARVEAYHKTYRRLITNDAQAYYANDGHGFARGVDVLLKASHRDLGGWLSYGYLDSKRRELDDPRELTATYGVRHSGTLVAQYRVAASWTLGTRVTATSGAPYKPVVGRSYDAARGIWRPVYGENNSGRLPAFSRLDLRATHLFSLPAIGGLRASSVCVVYVEALNVLNRHNTLRYSYSADYAERRSEDSYFGRRLIVAGVSLAW
ncbi:MAG: TonB-dependent receptor [Candidatus Eisenbacteria bacterium]